MSTDTLVGLFINIRLVLARQLHYELSFQSLFSTHPFLCTVRVLDQPEPG